MKITRVFLALLSASLFLAGCKRPPEVTIRIQGLVRMVGLHEPIAGAQVTVEWPPALGGGQTQIRTNSAGQYAVQRTLRVEIPNCEGLAITVEASGFASAYDRHSNADCEGGLIRKDFLLHPVPR